MVDQKPTVGNGVEPESSLSSKVEADEKPPEQKSAFKSSGKREDSSSASEVVMLEAMLTQKTEESLKRESKLRTEILEVEKQNKRLKLKRAADASRIEALEAEVARLRKVPVSVKPERRHSPKKEHVRGEAILVVDSSDEEPGNDNPEPSPSPSLCMSSANVRNSPVATAATDDPPRLIERPVRPTRDAWSPAAEGSTGEPLHNSDPDAEVRVKDEVIDVVIKTEGEPDKFKRVTLIKSEDGNFDIWNVDGFGLGPTVEVEEKYNRGFTRKVIGDALGGGHIEPCHHWNPKPGQEAKIPFTTWSRSWNSALPVSPGTHGMGFFSMSTCPVKPEPINFFVGEGTNDWRLLGTYDYLRWGEIAPHHISLLPPLVLDLWVNGMLSHTWGKAAIEEANVDLQDARKVKYTHESVLEALNDGRLAIPFTILKCVGYPKDWRNRGNGAE
ncbi:hypothetical protein DFH06DRAFT_565339 [Mycena polygramma]|nr:hypothetical protein DFH06DRAFT_565339 [Mycena polygramma]